MRTPSLPLLSLAVLLAACQTDDDKDATNDPDVTDPVVADTDTDTDTDSDTDTDTDSDTDTDTDTDTGGMGQYLDPESVELPDPADYDYSASVTFQVEDIVGDLAGTLAWDDPTILCDEATCPEAFEDAPGPGMMAIDSDWGHWVQDFLGQFPEARDGEYDDGWIGSLTDQGGLHNGVFIGTPATKTLQVGYPYGGWCGGLGGDLIKCESEHFVSMEHVLTCTETVPYMNYDPVTGAALDPLFDEVCEELELVPQTLIDQLEPYQGDLVDILASEDFAVTLKDDGKYLFRWGTSDKAPTDVRLLTTIELPPEWKTGDVYRVTRAELAVVHTIGNSPNDQIRPEDLENEGATGRLPTYTEQPDGTWTSNVDCYESDGDFIPAGTVLKNPDWAIPQAGSADLQFGFTNAWYTTLDRDPFETDPVSGTGPRWRLKAPKFGQDIPGVEIPDVDCMEPPVKKDHIKYETGELTATVIDLLDWEAGVESPMALSTGWIAPTIQEFGDVPGVTVNGVELTEDLDLSVYVKGEGKALNLYKAVLYLDYEPL